MDKFFENPALKTKITSSQVKLQEMLIGYFLAPLCAMMANSIFSAYLTRYYADVLGLTDKQFGVFSMILPIVSTIFVVAGNILVGQFIDNTRTPAGKARPYLLLAVPIMAVAIILSDVLDHLEAKNGFRSDGFTMSIYGATMVGLAVLSMGIVNIFLSSMGYNAALTTQPTSAQTGMVIVYLCMDMIGFVISIVALWGMNVEKYLDDDKKQILERQKAAVLAEGGEWIEPAERERLEQEKADREAEEERIRELKARCAKHGLNFEEENKKYLEAQEKRKNSLIGKLLG